MSEDNYRVFIALASNLRPEHHFGMAWRMLEEEFKVVSESSIYRSKSVTVGDDYHNQVILLETPLSHDQLKEVLHRIEDDCKRDRSQKVVITMDLDILMYVEDDNVSNIHTGIYDYEHVRLPFLELGGHLIDPRSGTIFEKLRHVQS